MKKAPKDTTSPTTSMHETRTINLLATSWIRLGTAANVERIAPVEYSLVMKSDPITPTANCAKTMPTRLVCTGSKVSLFI